MKKLTFLFLFICLIAVAGCKQTTDAAPSQGGVVAEDPGKLIPEEEGKTDLKTVADFINHYAGVYYSKGLHYYKHDNSTDTGYKVDYKFRNGQIYTFNQHNEAFELIIEPVEAVLPSQNKAQLRHKEKGEVLVLNMTEEGLETYVSYILEKVSEDVLIKNEGIGANVPELAEYKGTYNSLAQDNKIDNYVAIDGEGNIFFHDANVTVSGGKASITESGELTVLENHENKMRKIIFKFDEGVYRRFAIDGARENVDETYIGICEKTTDFIEDRFADAYFATDDKKDLEGLYEGTPNYVPTKVQGYSMRLNEPMDDGIGRPVGEGAICFTGNFGNNFAGIDNVMHISILKGNQLHVMGKYNVVFTFSDDWKTATYDGNILKLRSGEIKNATAAARQVKRINRKF